MLSEKGEEVLIEDESPKLKKQLNADSGIKIDNKSGVFISPVEMISFPAEMPKSPQQLSGATGFMSDSVPVLNFPTQVI